MITDMFAKAKPTRFVLEQGRNALWHSGLVVHTRPLTPSIAAVTSTGDGPICSQATNLRS
jgi:hypothetical protein